ncbi:MAG TPA: carbonic anhydrase [Actinomycetota bacterium]|nr:carbonic anhydrase [Actinomycetota bacterium]
MSELDALLEANRRFASGFDRGDLPIPPARKVAVLACMDARLDPARFLGLDLGDAHIIRNAGGRATEDVIRSLILSSWLLGTREFAVVHHTGCGMLTFSNEEFRARLREETGADASGIDFLPFADLEESVREDVQRIRSSPLMPGGVTVRGFVYDVGTGLLSEVEERQAAA